MITASLLLILAAVVTLGLGLVRGSNAFLIGSIAASLLAAIVLVVGARRASARRTAVEDEELHGGGEIIDEPTTDGYGEPVGPARDLTRRRGEGTVYTGRGPGARVGGATGETMVLDDPARGGVATVAREDEDLDDDDLDDEDPPDEPAAQAVSSADAAIVARMSTEVLVIDGRPRYHRLGCVHLLGRESEPLPVSEAVELGFSPCSLCEPDSALLAEAHRS